MTDITGEEGFRIPGDDDLEGFEIPDAHEDLDDPDAPASAGPDLDLMRQDTLDLIAILDAHSDHSAEDVMSGLLRFADALQESRTRIQIEMRMDQSAKTIHAAMLHPLVLAVRYGARELEEITARASLSFVGLLEEEDSSLDGKATADTLVWLTVAGQTLVAVKTLFQAAHLYGRAPNGKKLSPPS